MDGRNLIFGLLSFKSDDGDGNEHSRKAIGLYKIRKKQLTKHVQHTFLLHYSFAVTARLRRSLTTKCTFFF